MRKPLEGTTNVQDGGIETAALRADRARCASRGGAPHAFSDGLELFARISISPRAWSRTRSAFDRLVASLAAKAPGRSTSAIPKVGGMLSAPPRRG
jgi:hypothetical protein